MLHTIAHTAVALRGQTWAGQTWLANKWAARAVVGHVVTALRPVFHFGLPPVK